MEIDWTKSKEIVGTDAQLAAVQQNGDALRYCHQPTEAVMLAAVQQNGYALRYFKRGWIDEKSWWDEYFSLVKANEELWEKSVACGELYFKKAEEARKLFMELTNVQRLQK